MWIIMLLWVECPACMLLWNWKLICIQKIYIGIDGTMLCCKMRSQSYITILCNDVAAPLYPFSPFPLTPLFETVQFNFSNGQTFPAPVRKWHGSLLGYNREDLTWAFCSKKVISHWLESMSIMCSSIMPLSRKNWVQIDNIMAISW